MLFTKEGTDDALAVLDRIHSLVHQNVPAHVRQQIVPEIVALRVYLVQARGEAPSAWQLLARHQLLLDRRREDRRKRLGIIPPPKPAPEPKGQSRFRWGGGR